jgi:hypothetical protein
MKVTAAESVRPMPETVFEAALTLRLPNAVGGTSYREPTMALSMTDDLLASMRTTASAFAVSRGSKTIFPENSIDSGTPPLYGIL